MTDATWITGVGVGVPHGWSFDEVMDGLLAGRSAVRTVRGFDVTDYPSTVAAELGDTPRPPDIGEEFATWTRLEQLAVWCAATALRDAALWERRTELRIGLVLGTAGEGPWFWEEDSRANPTGVPCGRDRRPLTPFVAGVLDVSGPTITLSTACATGNFALSQARRWLQLGWCDVCLAGACDRSVSPLVLASFGNLRAVSRRNDDPVGASRPFDRGRDGFVLGEGGTVFVLEPSNAARARGARVYGELAAVGLTSDAYHPVVPNPDPAQAAAAVRKALAEAGVNAADVDYVNAHGTGTPVGDVAEAVGLRQVFGEHWRRVPVSATKSMTGHPITAASALEALACLGAMARGAIPPTINLTDPDPACELCHVPHAAREARVRVAVSNSFGFGGSNSCTVLRAV